MNARSALSFVLLSAAAIGSDYLASISHDTRVGKTINDTDSKGYYVRAAQILATGSDGLPLYEIEAEYAEQQENRDIELQNVRVRYSSGADVPWQVKANGATIRYKDELLRLSGNVIAVSNEGSSGQVTELRTPLLEIDPHAYRAETDDRVQLSIGSRSLTGTGMLALLQENRLELKSNVSGIFTP